MTFIILDRRFYIGTCAALSLAFILGILIGYFGPNPVPSASQRNILTEDRFRLEADLVANAIDGVDSDSIRAYLHELSNEPHIAGESRDAELKNWIKSSWEKSGLDRVIFSSYDMFLSLPNKSHPNKIYLLDEIGKVNFTSQHKESVLRKEDDHVNFIDAFNAYTPAAEVKGKLVFVNYGRVEDLQLLDKLGISLDGKIAISRYGKIFRGNKLQNCYEKGAIGLILFSDPADVAISGTETKDVYPNTIFLPGSGIQRGSTFLGDGDPLSPGWPSVENAYRLTRDQAVGLPNIPAQPIGYNDAKVLLEKLGGPEAPNNDWKGGIKGVSYRIGGEFLPKYENWSVKLEVNNYEKTVKDSNVIGIIFGNEEPDRYVFLSNHRDAWGYGAVDPSSGTAQLMEVVRILGDLKKNHGWRPKRTIVFCSWAAEEYGLLGSNEWVSEKINKIMQRSVGLVNTDICVSGPIFKPGASSVLYDIVYEASKHAAAPPNSSANNYYEFWKEWWNKEPSSSNISTVPLIRLLGSGSDHAPFAFYAGVPAVVLKFQDDYKAYPGIGQYPTYHTGFETFYLVDKIIDPGFKLHRICAQTTIHILLNLADSALIPYNLHHHPIKMKKSLDEFEANGVTKILQSFGATLKHIRMAVEQFDESIKNFIKRTNAFLRTSSPFFPMKLRMVNDQLMQLERVFLLPGGMPNRSEIRNVIYGPSKYNTYGESVFPGITDLLHNIDQLQSSEKKIRQEAIKKHISDVMIIIQNAASFLDPVELI